MNKKHFHLDISAVFNDGVQLYKKYFNELITAYLSIFILTAVNVYLILPYYSKSVFSVVAFIISIFSLILTLTLYIYIHCREENEHISIIRALQNVFPRLIPVIVTEIIYVILVALGLIAFIIPGIIVFIMFSQALFYSLLEAKSPVEALKASRQLTHGVRRKLFSFYIILGAITIILSILADNILPVIVQQFINSLTDSFSLALTFCLWIALKKKQP